MQRSVHDEYVPAESEVVGQSPASRTLHQPYLVAPGDRFALTFVTPLSSATALVRMFDRYSIPVPQETLAFACGVCSGLVFQNGPSSAMRLRTTPRLPGPVYRPRRKPLAVRASAMNAKPASSPVDAKEETKEEFLRVALNRRTAELEEAGELKHVRDLLLKLEATPDARPETAVFTEFALSGTWELSFSTSPTRGWDDIQIDRLLQIVDPAAKTITNSCLWSLQTAEENEKLTAKLDIVSGYSFQDDSAIMNVDVPSHQLRLVEDDSASGGKSPSFPSDIQSIIERLQSSLPKEFWDSSGQVDPATFMDFDFRIACVISERLQGIRSVYTRLPADE